MKEFIKKSIRPDPGEFIPGMQVLFSAYKAINVIHHINHAKNKKSHNHLKRNRKAFIKPKTHP